MIWTQQQLRTQAERIHGTISKADRLLTVRYDLLRRKPKFWTARPHAKVDDPYTVVGTYTKGIALEALYEDMKATAAEYGEVR